MSHINTYHDFIKEQFINIGIKLNDDQINKFITYYEMLIEKNKVVNLTAITDFKEVVVKHFVDSVLAYKVKNFNSKLSFKSLKIIDVGTGAGFPGIPLKIVFDNLNLTLLDSLNKRVVFLQEVIFKMLSVFMEEQKILDAIRITEKNTIYVYQGLFQIYLLYLNTVFHLSKIMVFLFLIKLLML